MLTRYYAAEIDITNRYFFFFWSMWLHVVLKLNFVPSFFLSRSGMADPSRGADSGESRSTPSTKRATEASPTRTRTPSQRVLFPSERSRSRCTRASLATNKRSSSKTPPLLSGLPAPQWIEIFRDGVGFVTKTLSHGLALVPMMATTAQAPWTENRRNLRRRRTILGVPVTFSGHFSIIDRRRDIANLYGMRSRT